ncbi:dual specificity protein phosphatase family protein [Candidatus Daviesbacteria bacterium]|nr:dual specificity protein phosphatase family protein [Candidatus Daviesbacteria bacterium]
MNNNHQRFQLNQITDLIYLGTNLCCTTMPHLKVLFDLGIKADIDLEEERQEQTPNIDTYLWLPVKDHSAPTQEQLDTGVAVIDSLVKNQKKVYIHCKNGHGRSPTILAAYFINQGKTVEEAIRMIKEKRAEIHLEEVQIQVLLNFQQRLQTS